MNTETVPTARKTRRTGALPKTFIASTGVIGSEPGIKRHIAKHEGATYRPATEAEITAALEKAAQPRKGRSAKAELRTSLQSQKASYLAKQAKAAGVKGWHKMNKAALVEALVAAS